MLTSKSMHLAVIITGLAALVFIGPVLSQDSRPAAGPWAGPGGVRGQPMDPEQMKKMMEDFRKQAEKRLQDALGATDEEWKVLQPKIEKVQVLSLQARGGMGGRMFVVGMGGPMGPDANNPSDVAKKFDALQKVLKNTEAKPEELNAALKEYRDAKAKAKEELEKAQKELKDILTVRQEAQLVANGLLE